MAIDYAKLNGTQRQTYDFWVKVAKKPVDQELEDLLGLVAKPKPRVRKEIHEDKEKVAREAEAVLLHLRRVDTLMQKECLECALPFATNYAYAGRCSDDCIKASLHRVGIEWNPEKTAQERWNGPGVNGEIPAIVTPETLTFLKRWARTILSWDDDSEHKKHLELHEKFREQLSETVDLRMPAQPHMVNGKQNGWSYPLPEIPEGKLTVRTDDDWDNI